MALHVIPKILHCVFWKNIHLIILQLSSNKWQKNAESTDNFQQGKSKSGLFWSKWELQEPANSRHICKPRFETGTNKGASQPVWVALGTCEVEKTSETIIQF